MNTKRFILLYLILIPVFVSSQTMHKAYLDYIKTYSSLAVEQQHLYQIPASITLAQGLLESGAGKSRLASEGNNHFGIKCHDWVGARIYADDDAKNECFRKYNSVRESYEDHSKFLSNRGRYSSLFTLNPTDYKSWARGLKSAGYATDPNYANKLIKLIEDYDLHKFDLGLQPDNRIADSDYNKEYYVWGKASVITLGGHQLLRNNGVKCVFSEAGDTYGSIADEFNISVKKILEYNDLKSIRDIEPGSIIYLSKKKKKASAEFTSHTVSEGESLYRIAQKYGIRLQSLYELNQLPYNSSATVGMKLKLR